MIGKFIERVGFFRLMLIPIGVAIIITAIVNQIIGMGIVGGIILIFGVLNKCLLMGKCDIPEAKNKWK
ncbi:MAG: hypothetical protein AB7O73_07640 [Bacteroidia bacterium]